VRWIGRAEGNQIDQGAVHLDRQHQMKLTLTEEE
jgi:hypothetical protein